ncbi:unnamed protein product, partial [Allacma fusca]
HKLGSREQVYKKHLNPQWNTISSLSDIEFQIFSKFREISKTTRMKYLAVVLTLAIVCALCVESKKSEITPTTPKPDADVGHESPGKEQDGMRAVRDADNSTDIASAGTLVIPPSDQKSTEVGETTPAANVTEAPAV